MNTGSYRNLLAQLDKVHRHNRQGSYQTRRRYYESMKRFCRFLAGEYRLEKLRNISPKHIEAYVEYMKQKNLRPATVKTELAAIRFMHDKLSDPRHELPDNTQLDLERRSFGAVDRSWKSEEFDRFIQVCRQYGRDDYAAIAHLGRYAGLRIHESFRLDTAVAEHVLRSGTLIVKGKGGLVRTIPADTHVQTEIENALTQTSRGHKLFVTAHSQTDTEIGSLQDFIARYRLQFQAEERTYPLHAHGWRHTYAQEQYLRLRQTGQTEMEAKRKVSKLLGHNRPDIVNIYLAGLKDGDDDV